MKHWNLHPAGRLLSAVVLTVVLAACASEPKKTSTGEFIDDTVLTTKVKAALLNEPAVNGLAINVETFKGTVQLSGFVKTVAERNRAVDIARTVPGIKQVRNDILIR